MIINKLTKSDFIAIVGIAKEPIENSGFKINYTKLAMLELKLLTNFDCKNNLTESG